MGDPRKTRKKYSTPAHPWQKERLDEEKAIIEKYALKNKQEIWKMSALLRQVKNQAKRLSALTSKQAEKEKELLLKRLVKHGLLSGSDKLDQVLILKQEDVLEKRLQSVVFRKGLSRSMKQARQFITHGHVKVNDQVITSPSYLVLKNEEESVTFSPRSSLSDAEHPERKIEKVVAEKEGEKEKKE